MKVVHIAAPAPAGGLESVVQALAIGHHREGLDVEVIAVLDREQDDLDHPFLTPLTGAGVSTHPLFLSSRGYLRERREIARILRRGGVDVVHTHGHRPDLLDAGVARRLDIPTVTTIHGSSKPTSIAELYEWLQFRALKRFDAVIAVSNALVPSLRSAGVPDSRIRVVPNAWDGQTALPRRDARKLLGLRSDAKVLGWVGRLIPVKGPDVFLEAFAKLDHPGIQASVIGDGPERPRLDDIARAADLGDRVHFHGRVDGAGRLFSAFDGFVLSSRSEGTPMVVFEAMAARVPVVATRVGGVPEVLSETTAFLAPPDDPPALAEAIDRMLDGDTAGRVERAAEDLQQRFTTGQWLSRHEKIYREITAGETAS